MLRGAFHFSGLVCLLAASFAAPRVATAKIVAHFGGWNIREEVYLNVDRSAIFEFKDENSPFSTLTMGCRGDEIYYYFSYRGGWANARDVKISHAGSAILAKQLVGEMKMRNIVEAEADKVTAFIEAGLRSGDPVFSFEAQNKTRDDRYDPFSKADLRGFEDAKKSVKALCPRPKERESAPVAVSGLVGTWSVSGVGPSATLSISPNGSFTFSYVQTFSHQRVTSNGRWQEGGGNLYLFEGRGRRPQVCAHVGDGRTQYLSNCSLTGVLNRIN